MNTSAYIITAMVAVVYISVFINLSRKAKNYYEWSMAIMIAVASSWCFGVIVFMLTCWVLG